MKNYHNGHQQAPKILNKSHHSTIEILGKYATAWQLTEIATLTLF